MNPKEEMQFHLVKARDICQKATKENRDFTPEERQTVSDHLSEAHKLKAEMARAKADLTSDDAALKAAIQEFESGFFGGRQAAGRWSQDVLKAMGDHAGRKLFMPTSGSVSASPLSSTIGTLEDDARAETLLQFIPREPIAGDAFSYLRETVRTNNAAPVAYSERKPTSVYTLERIDARISTIAHLSEPVPNQFLSDAPALIRYLDTVLRTGVLQELEYQILNGSGTYPDLPGVMFAAGVLVQAWNTDLLTTSRQALTTLELASIAPDGWVINPSDWETFELLESTGGELVMGGPGRQLPVDRSLRRLWGLPVALSVQQTAGTGVLASWKTALTLMEREATRITWSEAFHHGAGGYDEEDSTGFETNETKFRAEGRWGLAINRPSAIVIVSLEEGS